MDMPTHNVRYIETELVQIEVGLGVRGSTWKHMVAAATAQRGTQGTTRSLTLHLSGPSPKGKERTMRGMGWEPSPCHRWHVSSGLLAAVALALLFAMCCRKIKMASLCQLPLPWVYPIGYALLLCLSCTLFDKIHSTVNRSHADSFRRVCAGDHGGWSVLWGLVHTFLVAYRLAQHGACLLPRDIPIVSWMLPPD